MKKIKYSIDELIKFFEDNGFTVELHEQDNVQCAELGKHTNRGVDMGIFLNPFTPNEFKEYVKDFDIDEYIDLHRQNEKYKKDFTISQSLKDFTEYYNDLVEIAIKL